MNKLIFSQNCILIFLVGPSDSCERYSINQWLKVGTILPTFGKIYFVYQFPQPLYGVMLNKIENHEFFRGVTFEFVNSLKNNGTKCLLIFEDSDAEICNFNDLVHNATADRHRSFSTIYIKHKLFHQSKLGRHV